MTWTLVVAHRHTWLNLDTTSAEEARGTHRQSTWTQPRLSQAVKCYDTRL